MKKKRLLTSMLAFAMVLSLFSFNNGMNVYAAEPAFTGYDFVKYGSFKEGDPITIRLDFDTPVTVTGTPTIPVTVGTDTDNAVYTGNIDSDSLEFVYAADNQANWSGPFVTGPVSLNGGTIKGLDGQDANLSGFTGGSDMGIVIDNVDPIIQNIERSNPTPAAINSFAEDNIQFKVYFNEPVTGAGINDFTITATSTAAVTISSITGNGTDTITVNGTTLDGEGSLRIDYLTSVGNITDLAGNPVASNFTTGESYDVVNVVTFPVVIRVEVPAETYGPSDVLLFCIHFSEPVVVTGTPSLNITIGGVSRSAEYFDGSGEKNLFFRYDLQESDPTDLDGIGMSTELSLNGGTVKSVADSDDSDTILYFIDDLTHMRVDMIAPTISSAAIVGTNDYVLVTLSEPVYNKLDTIFTNYPVYVDAKCFELKFSQNGGNATGASISSVVSETGDPLTGGEAVLRFNLNINGVPSGVETIEIKPSSAGYVYDLVDNPMSTAQSTSALTLVDETPTPDLVAPTAGSGGAVTTTAKTSSSATITWTAATDDATAQNALEYTVRRSTTNLGTDPVAISNGAVTVQGWTTNITSYTASGLSASTTYYFYVGVRDAAGRNTLYTPISVTTNAVSGGDSGGSGGGTTTVPTTPQTSAPVMTINLPGNANVGIGVLTGEVIKSLESKEGVIEVKTASATYTLPSYQINIADVQSQLEASSLSDIRVNIEIGEPAKNTLSIIADKEKAGEFKVVAQAVDFTINCTYGDKKIEVSRFNAYVERTIAIPDGVDPSKITTGVVIRPDGTVYHVPTKITVVNGKYYAVINSLTNSTYAVIYNEANFKDVTNHWAKDAVNNMGSRMVLSGDANGNFAPDRDITRAEFAAIIVRALGLAPIAGANNFTDVADTDWFNGYVNTAVSYGIITGCDADTFGSNDKITREQAMVIISRALDSADMDVAIQDSNAVIASYSDNESISDYAKKGVASCVSMGVVSGRTADTIAPGNTISRAEVATIIERMLQKADLIN